MSNLSCCKLSTIKRNDALHIYRVSACRQHVIPATKIKCSAIITSYNVRLHWHLGVVSVFSFLLALAAGLCDIEQGASAFQHVSDFYLSCTVEQLQVKTATSGLVSKGKRLICKTLPFSSQVQCFTSQHSVTLRHWPALRAGLPGITQTIRRRGLWLPDALYSYLHSRKGLVCIFFVDIALFNTFTSKRCIMSGTLMAHITHSTVQKSSAHAKENL